MSDLDTDQSTSTEDDALSEILRWSQERPLWQRDALRRLIQKEQLGDDDIGELTEICKQASHAATPLSDEHIRAPDAESSLITLHAIHNVRNVNALPGDQRLTFNTSGVTVVYGDNGSGKSGYVRILKQACRARGRAEDKEILRNIYSDTSGPQQAQIDFTNSGCTHSETWRAGYPPTSLLSAVSVFDARTANVHVDEANKVAYTPFPIQLLERLARGCRTIRDRLDREISSLEGQKPASLQDPKCAPTTAVGRLIAELNERTSPEAIKPLVQLSDDERSRLATLRDELAQDPKHAASRMQAQLQRLDTLISRMTSLADAISENNAVDLRTLSQDYLIKKEAARVAAEDLFADEPLSSIGGSTWQRLWDAARVFSTQAAYPGHAFPVTDANARCVLCLQPLTTDASDRLHRFEAFVQDRTKTERDDAEQALKQKIAALRKTQLGIGEIQEAHRFLRDELNLAQLAMSVRHFALHAKWRLRSLERHHDAGQTTHPALPGTELQAARDDLGRRISALLDEEESEKRKALQKEFQELTDRDWLARIKGDVLAEIKRKKELAELQAAKRDTDHQQISKKSTSLAHNLVTNRLRGRFAQEIARLNIAGLAVELQKARTEHGVPHFQVSFIHKPEAKAGQILSEGEHRCVALAAFLAELATTGSESGIVLDDPVSSLDHLHREDVARRLAEEGRSRQVIVFTHDLPFLFLLQRECDEQSTDVAIRHVYRRHHEPGYTDNKTPMKAQKPEDRLQSLEKHLNNTRIQYDQDPEGQWIINAKGLIGHLRDTWEAAVESAVEPVLRTFASKVDTRGFIRLSVITEQDAEYMRSAYGRVSEHLHKVSDEMNPRAPTPDQIAEEIEALRSWIDDLRSRQKDINTR